jgi:hypothetical protein
MSDYPKLVTKANTEFEYHAAALNEIKLIEWRGKYSKKIKVRGELMWKCEDGNMCKLDISIIDKKTKKLLVAIEVKKIKTKYRDISDQVTKYESLKVPILIIYPGLMRKTCQRISYYLKMIYEGKNAFEYYLFHKTYKRPIITRENKFESRLLDYRK